MTTIDPSTEMFDQLDELERDAAFAAHLGLDRDARRLIADGAWPQLAAERRLRALVGLHVALHGEMAAVRYTQALLQAVHGARRGLERRGATEEWVAPLFAPGPQDGWDTCATERVVREAFLTFRWT